VLRGYFSRRSDGVINPIACADLSRSYQSVVIGEQLDLTEFLFSFIIFLA
jgi:hypothetical protein